MSIYDAIRTNIQRKWKRKKCYLYRKFRSRFIKFRNQIKISLQICGNKMSTRCNKGFYCRFYSLLNMFRAPLCPSSEAQKYYTVVAVCGISCCVFQVVGLMVTCPFCRMLQHLKTSTNNLPSPVSSHSSCVSTGHQELSQRVTVPYAACAQLYPPEDEHLRLETCRGEYYFMNK